MHLSTIPYAISFLYVILRFWSRWATRAGYWLDDFTHTHRPCICNWGFLLISYGRFPEVLEDMFRHSGPNVVEYWHIGLFMAKLTVHRCHCVYEVLNTGIILENISQE
ncbi:hypothetical protein F5Y16DRAFT_78224 [Xylariaceae sp. FL0255]|nr:hypothetical protein F5Y16DRAFT_78224 [Xylariaceae sp. FL0255]